MGQAIRSMGHDQFAWVKTTLQLWFIKVFINDMTKKSCKLIDSDMTLHGLRFSMDGCRMERFNSNAPILYMHVRGVVYGQWKNFRRDGDAYYADPEFDMEDPEAVKLAGKVDRGVIKAVSMGAYPHKVEIIDGEPWATDWEAIECSYVDAGSNKNALVLYAAGGEAIENPEQYIELQISNMTKTAMVVPGPVTDFPIIALAAGLNESATTEAVVNAINAIKAENATLKLAATESKKKQIKSMMDQAVADRKISAEQRPQYEELAAANLEAVSGILTAMPSPVNLVGYAQSGQASGDQSSPQNIDLAAEWDKYDHAPGDALYNLSVQNPDRYRELFKAKFGVYPA